MRILHLYKDYYPVLGGIENHVKVVAERQAKDGHDVTVLVTSPTAQTTEEMRQGVHIIKAGRLATVASTPLSIHYGLILRRQRPDVLHLHFPYPLAEVSFLLAGHSQGAVLSYHSDVVRQKQILRFYRPVMMRALERVDRILVASPNYQSSSIVLPHFAEKCRIVAYGIEADRFGNSDSDEASALRQSLGPGPLLLFVGVLRYYKGLDYMIRAMAHVEAKLVIVGGGPMETAWHALVRELGLEERIHFAGRVPDAQLPAYYGACDIFVLPASERSEAFGLVQLEAMHSGLPVISTELGTGTSFVNKHMESGLVVPPKDPNSLAQAANRLITDHTLRAQLAAGAQARAQEFSVDHMMQGIYAAYTEALAHAD